MLFRLFLQFLSSIVAGESGFPPFFDDSERAWKIEKNVSFKGVNNLIKISNGKVKKNLIT